MPSFQPLAGMLQKRSKSRPLSAAEMANLSADSPLLALPPFTLIPPLVASVVASDSPAYEEARALQAARFARASAPSPNAYLETVHLAPEHAITLAICRQDSAASGQVIATVSLELPSARTMESTVLFIPDSPSDRILTRKVYGFIRGFAMQFNPDWQEVLDVLDTIGSALCQIARQCGIECLWFVPRRPLMGLLLAEIPGFLPPYRFTLCTDVLRWKIESPALQKIRELRMKEIAISLDDLPVIYQIAPAVWEEDIAKRMALLEQRKREPNFPHVLQAAMRNAYQQARTQIDLLHKRSEQTMSNETETQEGPTKKSSGKQSSPPAAAAVASAAPASEATEMGTGQQTVQGGTQGFLHFAASTELEASYLRQVVEQGGADAQRYKTLSYDLLQIDPGMQVLDVGCGIGLDLPPLTDRVGEDGLVIGLDHNPDLLRTAREAIAGRPNARVVTAVAEEMPFPNRSFDRVRADRVLLHIAESARVLAEMGRVLRPGGRLGLVEPDWKALSVFPASPAGGDDDHILNAVLAYNQRKTVHPLMGRQLLSLLRQPGPIWDEVKVQAEIYTFTSLAVADTVLQLPRLAQELAKEEPALADELNAWLQAMEAAAQRGEFLVSMPLFFASARKAAL